MLQHSFLLQHSKLCRDIENYVTIEKTVLRHKRCKKPKKAENGYFGLFSCPFHPRTINTGFFLVFRAMGRWENTSHGVSLSKLLIFLSFVADFDF